MWEKVLQGDAAQFFLGGIFVLMVGDKVLGWAERFRNRRDVERVKKGSSTRVLGSDKEWITTAFSDVFRQLKAIGGHVAELHAWAHEDRERRFKEMQQRIEVLEQQLQDKRRA